MNFEELAINNSPIIYEHELEKYHLSSFDEWFDKCTPYFLEGTNKWFMKQPDDFEKSGVIFNKNQVVTCNFVIPATSVEQIDNNERKINSLANEGDIDLIYNLWFDYNGPKRLIGIQPIEDHIGDLENFIVRINKEGRAYKYFLSCHGDYQMFNPTEMRFENNHPVIYSSINSHALYRQAGTFIRFYGFGNDTTDDDKKRRIEPKIRLLNKNDRILQYPKYLKNYKPGQRGNFGPDGVGAFIHDYDETNDLNKDGILINNIKNTFEKAMNFNLDIIDNESIGELVLEGKGYKIIDEPMCLNSYLVNIYSVLLWLLIPCLIVYIIPFIYNLVKDTDVHFSSRFTDIESLVFILVIEIYIMKIICFVVLKTKKFAIMTEESFMDWFAPIRFY